MYTVEHPFIFSALELYGFGKQFRSIISSLYRDTNCSVSLTEGTTSCFNISRVIIFILAAEMLALAMKNSDIEQLKIFDDSIHCKTFHCKFTVKYWQLGCQPHTVFLQDYYCIQHLQFCTVFTKIRYYTFI